MSECMFVCERVHMSVCITVCVFGHDMLSSNLWGAPLLSQNQLFLSASWNMGSFLWTFTGQERDASFMDFIR